MLVDFKFSNFRCFKDTVLFSMEPLSQNGKNPNVIETHLKKVPQLYRTSGIFGPNASGKSTVLTAISFLQFLLKKSYKNSIDYKFPDESYALSANTTELPILLELRFIMNDRLYHYKVVLNKDLVREESLAFYPISSGASAKRNQVFSRSIADGYVSFAKMQGIMQSWSDETVHTRLFLSEIVNNRNCKVTEVTDAYSYMIDTLSFIDVVSQTHKESLKQISEGKGQDIIRLMKEADLGLEKITVETPKPEDVLEALQKEQTDLPVGFVEKIASGEVKFFDCKSYHKTVEGALKTFAFERSESEGTKAFFTLAAPVLDALREGKVLIVDELDSSLHPHLVKYLVSLFNNPDINKNKAQLIFTSHAHYLMDGENLSRDQIWFTSKETNEGFSSELYSLSDFKAIANRKSVSFYDAYMNGIYGAVPSIGRF